MAGSDTYDERARLVWKLFDSGMPVSDIAWASGIHEATVKALIMDAWTEGVATWKARHGVHERHRRVLHGGEGRGGARGTYEAAV